MVAGLPGTGVGGIFYLLLAVAMPFVELFRTLRGKGSIRRWGFIAVQLTLVVWIFVVIWAEVWVLNISVEWGRQLLSDVFGWQLAANHPALLSTKAMSYASAFGGLITLSSVFVAVHLLRLRFAAKKEAQIVRGLR
jgi:hypothetical protein